MVVRLLFLILCSFFVSTVAQAEIQQEVYVTGHVQSFGGYALTEAVSFVVSKPGRQEIGRIAVDGMYNGEYPWIMRAYTDNVHFSGVAGTIRRPEPAGLVSKDALFAIPLFINSPSFGNDTWRRIPDLNESGYLPYHPNPDPKEEMDFTDCVLMGVDPRNSVWVAGPDGLLNTPDDNPLGDNTVGTPFELILQADVASNSVKATYDAVIYIEIVPAP